MKNKTRLYHFLVVLLFTNLLNAQNIEQAFVGMPDEYYLSLPSAQRKEMVRAFKSDSIPERKNRFRGKSAILEIDTVNQLMKIQNSPSAKVDLKILKSTTNGNPAYFVLIFTACAPICDSHIGFYNTNWSFLKNSLLPKVSIVDFLDVEKIEKEGKKTADIAEKFDIVFLESRFLKNSNDIEVSLNTAEFMDKENFDRLKVYLKGDKLRFNWIADSYKQAACYW